MLADGGFLVSRSLLAELGPDSYFYDQYNFSAACYSGVGLYSNGNQMYRSAGGGWVDTTHDWLVSGENSNFWVRATDNGPDNITGTTGSWLALTTNRTWSLDVLGPGDETCSLTLEIALSASGAGIISTQIYTIYAEYVV